MDTAWMMGSQARSTELKSLGLFAQFSISPDGSELVRSDLPLPGQFGPAVSISAESGLELHGLHFRL